MAGAPLGNNNATRTLRWRAALDRAIAQDDGKQLRAAANKLLAMAADGDLAAIRELADRIDGKPAQAMILQGDSENPVEHKLTVELVKAANADSDRGTS